MAGLEEEHGGCREANRLYYGFWNACAYILVGLNVSTLEQEPSCEKKKVKNMEGDLTGDKEKVSEVFEVKAQALLYIKSLGAYNSDYRQKRYLSLVGFGDGDSLLEERGDVGHIMANV